MTATICEFNLPGEDVYITLSGPTACPDVAEGTVLLIERQLVDYQSFAALNLDQRRFKKFDPTWPRRIGYQGYIDNKDGLLLKAFNNKVFQIAYIPVITKRQFCPAYYGNPRQFIETYVEHAPPVSIECPKHALTAGKVLSLKAWYNPGLSILLTWYVDGAKLVSGQGRRKIAVDTNGLEGRTIKISVGQIPLGSSVPIPAKFRSRQREFVDRAEQSLAADGAIACFSSNFFLSARMVIARRS